MDLNSSTGDMSFDFENKDQIVPRLRSRDWDGIRFGLTAELLPEYIPDLPILAIGIDRESTVAFPSSSVFKQSGLTINQITEKAINYLIGLNPEWEDFVEDEHLPKTLIHTGEYAAEQILNKRFLAEAAKKLNAKSVVLSPVSNGTCMATALTDNKRDVFNFVTFNLMRYVSYPSLRITPSFIMSDRSGQLIGVLGYSKALLTDVTKFITDKDDSHIDINKVIKTGKNVIEIVAHGSDPQLLFDRIWTAIVSTINKDGLRPTEPAKDIHIEVVLVTDKMPPLDLFNDEIDQLTKKFNGSSQDLRSYGVQRGAMDIKILYKKSSSLL